MNAELPISLVEPRDFTAALGGLVRALRQRADWTQPEIAGVQKAENAPDLSAPVKIPGGSGMILVATPSRP